MDASKAVELSRARSVGPFVQIVASATWSLEIDGLLSSASSSSTCVGIGELLLELGELLLGVPPNRLADLDVSALDLESHRVPSLDFFAASGGALRLTDCPRQSHDLDMACTSLPEGRCGRRRGRAARVDVVDEADAARRRTRRRKRRRDVPTSLLQAQPSLPFARVSTAGGAASPAAPSAGRARAQAPRPDGDRASGSDRRHRGRTRAPRRSGGASVSTTRAPASRARHRCPRSFQAETTSRARSS